MQTSSATCTLINAADGAVAAAPRLFDRLDAISKERITILLGRVQSLLPMEQEAFLQELYLQLEDARKAQSTAGKTLGKLVHYTSPSLEAVQARDCGYVMPRTLVSGEGSEGGPLQITDGAAARRETQPTPPCSLEDLVRTPGMFGDGEVAIRLDKMSLYDKLVQNMASRKVSEAAPKRAVSTTDSVDVPVVEEHPTAGPPQLDRGEQRGMELQSAAAAAATAAADAAVSAPRRNAPYRSNAYQAVRLAMSSPGFIAIQKPLSMAAAQTGYDGVKSVLNTTGMPIKEDDLREWFNELDAEGRGALSLEDFQRSMESLERDFGVTEDYVTLQRAGEQLAYDGRLSFEAFAYLVLRFARV
ncbi:hypothetical protein ABL78_3386 [Leptomonas seymouri]|uniref:EF-hand domain-containing protein n=1 Tax=Leptomonas seymouri TaxID=5684 RepID=A0A0N1I7W0_LEPSE|nr:hypothetical protein ABL78_3386 [Leptomonas seymouri]|eukprot:KPI87543.1 hypothetical protein ABL78_3386 [Leptomonas seymouri]